MVNKGDFVPLACSRQAQSIAELFNQAPRFDGTYATVVIKDLRTVFKATCCSQTNLLLEALWQQKTAILALPMVFNKLPFEMSCQDGLRYQVWEIERLFDEPRSVAAYSALFSRRCIKRGSAQVSYSRQDVNELRKVLAAVQSDVRHDPSWQASLYVAQAMTAKTRGVLSSTFRYLADFIEKNQASLDLLTKGNILYDCHQQPVLSDPVSELYEEDTIVPEVLSRDYVVAARFPAVVNGFDVTLESRCSQLLSAEEAKQRAKVLQEHGIHVVVGTPLCSEVRGLMKLSPANEKIWKFKGLSAALREGVLTNALS